ncbi:hypothetical protein SNEBB_009813 [Seison nebaliae]|nr:hypothetical protein SNEBB_009813 [Seison nebaliae]
MASTLSKTKCFFDIKFITGNSNKLKEVKQIVENNANVELTSENFDLPEYQGEADFVAKEKCKAAINIYKNMLNDQNLLKKREEPIRILVEDTSLGFTALNGLPGVYIKWFIEKLTPNGLPKLLAGFPDKSATATCIFAYAVLRPPFTRPPEIQLFRGDCHGKIVESRGSQTFGWDSIFLPVESKTNQTFGEMSKVEKNLISHRSKALDNFVKFLKSTCV